MTDANATKSKSSEPNRPELEPDAEGTDSNGDAAAKGVPADAESPESLRARITALEDALLRARAEAQNIQRRAANERVEAIRFGNADLLKSIVPVLDDLDRAVQHASEQADVAALLKGVGLVRENLLKALSSFGLEPIAAAGQVFDPRQHEALMQQPSEVHDPGMVIEEVAKGYRLHDRTLRPAKVIVASGGSSAE